MDYNKFKNTLLNILPQILPEGAEVTERNVQKNNGVIFEGMLIKAEPENELSTTIYFKDLYKVYEEKGNMWSVIEYIERSLDKKFDFDRDILTKYPEKKLFLKAINAEMNKDVIKNCPHKIEGDFVLTYHVMVEQKEDGFASGRITNKMFEKYNVSLEELHNAAMENTQKLFPLQFKHMEEVLFELASDIQLDSSNEIIVEGHGEFDMYVLTNVQRTNGATALFYPGVREKLAEQFPEGAYIIPSSVHELIIFSSNNVPEHISEEDITRMINEVNEQEVEEVEILGNIPYYLDGTTAQITPIHSREKDINLNQSYHNEKVWATEGKRLYRADNVLEEDKYQEQLENEQNIENSESIDIEP